MADPAADYQASVGTWAALLEGVRRSSVRPLVFFPSSAAVYGNPVALPVAEDAPLQPVSPYGWHKLMAETLARSYADTFGIRIVIARLFSVLGGLQRKLLAYELFERLLREDGALKLLGTGRETRDFLDADDLGEAILDLATLPAAASPLIVNVASGAETSTLELARQIVRVCAPGREVTCCGLPRPGDPLRWRADVSRLRSLLPGRRWTPVEAALHKAIALWRTPA
jgi:UDP-glucose 4-epimerase